MTTPATIDFTVYKGARFFKSITVNENWTGYTIHMEARYEKDDTSPITGWDLSTGSGITITSAGAGSSTFEIDVSHTVTDDLEKTALYDIIAIDGSGNRNFYFQGKLMPDTQVTRVA